VHTSIILATRIVMSDMRWKALEELGRRLEMQGYGVNFNCPYFAETGLGVFPRPGEPEAVIGTSVLLYCTTQGWEARVTPHGGPHWVRHASSIPELEAAALEGLRASETYFRRDVSPGPEWRIDP
jgi:hypothetical protein